MSNCADSNKELIAMTIIVGVIIIGLILMMPGINSIIDGGPTFPEGCWYNYPLNVTYSGQVVSSYPWSDICCTKQHTGYTSHNTYEKICWERLNDAYEVDDE